MVGIARVTEQIHKQLYEHHGLGAAARDIRMRFTSVGYVLGRELTLHHTSCISVGAALTSAIHPMVLRMSVAIHSRVPLTPHPASGQKEKFLGLVVEINYKLKLNCK